ncbi:GtrA family protein [Paraburkholderia denitrificans]|uniref:GtrA family protein n=1 Tax=Paraburkholderia denitrificans TaxID=694025 RepID=A0ABW0JAZ1_9BURK
MLIRFMNYNLAYAICYVIGIVVSYWFNLKFVFKESGSVLKFALYPLVYLIHYVVGAAVLNVFVSTLGGAKEYGPVVVVIVTLPVTYILSRVVLTRNGSTEDARQRS